MYQQLGLIGCGLMGGSFALALKKAGLVERVVGYSPSAATLERALALGVIDEAAPSALAAASGSNVVLLAVPVAATQATLEAIAPAMQAKSCMLVMDVGSTKTDVVQAARAALGPLMRQFVPAHPITGKEVAGVAHADVNLYQGCQTVLTPCEETPPARLIQAEKIWLALGARVHQMSPEAHDAGLASISHLPHLLAFAAMNSLIEQPEGEAYLALAGPGFRDFSRIAAGDARIWLDIFEANRAQVLQQSRLFREALTAMEEALQNGDSAALQQLISQASQRRLQWKIGAAMPTATAATAATHSPPSSDTSASARTSPAC